MININHTIQRHSRGTKNLIRKILAFILAAAVTASGIFFSPGRAIASEDMGKKVQPPEIMTWVTLSRANTWKAKLEATYGSPYYPKNTITRIGAQFFNVCSDGTISEPKSGTNLLWVQKFCQTNGIQFLLCFTNFTAQGFDWRLAVSAFYSNKEALINNMLGLVEKWSADGIDIDFEGTVKDNPYRAEFADFIQELSTRLHQKGKVLTVDSFPYIWSAPNVNWWPDWAGYVDCINSMGYNNLCGGSPIEWRTYKWQQEQAFNAGLGNHQLALGMAGDRSNYGEGGLGTGILDHIQENLSGNFNSQPSSVCIWSAAFGGKAWETPEVWEALHQLRTVSTQRIGTTVGEDSPTGGNSVKMEPPKAPTNLICQNKTPRSVTLVWTAPDGNRGVSYVIYVDSKLIGLTSRNDFTVTGLTANTTYCFTVKARNEAGEAATAVTVTTECDTPIKKQ